MDKNPMYKTRLIGCSRNGAVVFAVTVALYISASPVIGQPHMFAGDSDRVSSTNVGNGGIEQEADPTCTRLLRVSGIYGDADVSVGENRLLEGPYVDDITVHRAIIDCNGNTIDDDADVAAGTSTDCNLNSVPDECDITGSTSADCNGNALPDECEPLGAIIYVDAAATGLDDGTSWANAFTELQAALVFADCRRGAAPQIWVAAGTYRPDYDVDSGAYTGDRAASFSLVDGVALYGGFAGWETSVDQRDTEANETVLNGDLNGDDTDYWWDPSREENIHHVVSAEGLGNGALLDGVTVIGGNAGCTWWPCTDRTGGGMIVRMSRLVVKNCMFTGNHAWFGGALEVESGNVTVLNCDFDTNYGDEETGAIRNAGTIGIADCTFSNNQGYDGPGAVENRGTATLNRCLFAHNAGWEDAGAGGFTNFGTATVTDCRFVGNWHDWAGGICNGFWDSGANLTVINCSFVDNVPGAIVNYNSNPRIINCSVNDNWTWWYGGGAIANLYNSHPEIANSVLWGNSAGDIVDEPSQIWSDASSSAKVLHSCIQGLNVFTGSGNIGDDPLFIDGDLRLAPDSPCIDVGTNGAVPADLTTDLDGHPRIVDGDHDGLSTADMGAYEHQLDCNSNGIPDSQDLAAGTSEDCNTNGLPDECEADLDGDGVVDECDDCSDSDTSGTIVIDGCDSGVANMLFDDGCTMADLVAECAVDADDHGSFVCCIAHLTNEWKADGLITGTEKGRIQRCAAGADIPAGSLAALSAVNGDTRPLLVQCRCGATLLFAPDGGSTGLGNLPVEPSTPQR